MVKRRVSGSFEADLRYKSELRGVSFSSAMSAFDYLIDSFRQRVPSTAEINKRNVAFRANFTGPRCSKTSFK